MFLEIAHLDFFQKKRQNFSQQSSLKRVDQRIFDFATNVRNPTHFLVFLANGHKISQKRKKGIEMIWIIWIDSGLSRQSLDILDNFWIIGIVSGLSGKFFDYSDSLWIVRTVSKISR